MIMMRDTPSLGLPIDDDYEPSAEELDNFVYLVSKYTVGWIARPVDLRICLIMVRGKDSDKNNNPIRGNSGLSELCSATCEYLWDHICGKPDDFSPEDLFEHIKPHMREFYHNSTPEQRSQT